MYFHVENFLTIGELLEILPSLSLYRRQILQKLIELRSGSMLLPGVSAVANEIARFDRALAELTRSPLQKI